MLKQTIYTNILITRSIFVSAIAQVPQLPIPSLISLPSSLKNPRSIFGSRVILIGYIMSYDIPVSIETLGIFLTNLAIYQLMSIYESRDCHVIVIYSILFNYNDAVTYSNTDKHSKLTIINTLFGILITQNKISCYHKRMHLYRPKFMYVVSIPISF